MYVFEKFSTGVVEHEPYNCLEWIGMLKEFVKEMSV